MVRRNVSPFVLFKAVTSKKRVVSNQWHQLYTGHLTSFPIPIKNLYIYGVIHNCSLKQFKTLLGTQKAFSVHFHCISLFSWLWICFKFLMNFNRNFSEISIFRGFLKLQIFMDFYAIKFKMELTIVTFMWSRIYRNLYVTLQMHYNNINNVHFSYSFHGFHVIQR